MSTQGQEGGLVGKTMQLCLAHCVGISGKLTNITTEAEILKNLMATRKQSSVGDERDRR